MPLVVTLSLSFALLTTPSAQAADKALPTYACEGFDEPMNRPDIHIERSRVLPLRAKLKLSDGTYADDTAVIAPPQISLKLHPAEGAEVDKTGEVQVWDFGSGRMFVFDPEAHWKFDLGTDKLPAGNYTVSIVSGDPTEYRVDPPCSLPFVMEP